MGLFRRKKKAVDTTQYDTSKVLGTNWGVLYRKMGVMEKGPVVIEYDMDVAQIRPADMSDGCMISLTVPPKQLTKDLIPTVEMSKTFEAMEKVLLSKIKTPCLLVAIISGESVRNLAFQTNVGEALEAELNEIIKDIPEYKPSVFPSQNWNYYDLHVALSKAENQVSEDRKVVMAMIEAGAQMGQEVLTEHCIIGDPANLKGIADYLNTVESAQDISIDENQLIVKFNLPLVAPIIAETTTVLIEIAEQSNCQYDGWGGLINN